MNKNKEGLIQFDCIAIDGPAASGKSTLGKLLADRLGYLYFDTGVMYRAATLAAMQKNLDLSDESTIGALAREIQIDVQPPTLQDDRPNDVLLDGVDVTWEIRDISVERNVSQVSAYPEVRKELTEQQRRIGERGNVVMIGRDIGTVVMPAAKYKFYLEASAEERARRRVKELTERGERADYNEILAAMIKRDQIDSSRAIAPLKPAPDAMIINTDEMTLQQVYGLVLKIIGKDESHV
jgi:cytidylate kinase